MSVSPVAGWASAAAHLAIALVFAAVALSLTRLEVEGVIDPAASQIVTLGVGPSSSSSPCGCWSCTPIERSERGRARSVPP